MLLCSADSSGNFLEYFSALSPSLLVNWVAPHLAMLTICVVLPFFSDENLQNDKYLISLMDKQEGWVPIKIIADFKRVKLIS